MPAASPATTSTFDAAAELDRQAAGWAEQGHPVDDAALHTFAGQLSGNRLKAPTTEWAPFVLVVPAAAVPAAEAMSRTARGGKPGTVNQHAGDIDAFVPLPALALPSAAAYLLLDVERGSEFCNVAPEPAVATLTERGRTPLTVAEGIALITLHPEMLEKNHCFSLVGSRREDRRVPAIWISKGAPHLGWCFAGVPHSWLGVASAGERRAP